MIVAVLPKLFANMMLGFWTIPANGDQTAMRWEPETFGLDFACMICSAIFASNRPTAPRKLSTLSINGTIRVKGIA